MKMFYTTKFKKKNPDQEDKNEQTESMITKLHNIWANKHVLYYYPKDKQNFGFFTLYFYFQNFVKNDISIS